MLPEELPYDWKTVPLGAALEPNCVGLHIDVTIPGDVTVLGNSGVAVALPFGTAGVYWLPGRFRQVNAGGATFTAIQALGHRQELSA